MALGGDRILHGKDDSGSAPLKIGGKASGALPAAVTAGQRVDAYFDLEGRLHIVADSGGGGTQYAHDAAGGATPTGTLAMGRASAAAPADVSADLDLVGLWALRNGSQVVNLAGGSTLVSAGAGIASGALRVVSASDDPAVAALQIIDDVVAYQDAIAIGAQGGIAPLFIRDDSLTPITPAEGDLAMGRVDVNGAIWMQLAGGLAASVDSVAIGARATGVGTDTARDIDLDEAEFEIKATAGTLYGWYIVNQASTKRYVKLYNATAATVVVGTTTPVQTLVIPANGTDAAGSNFAIGQGMNFGTAICAAATTGVADADVGAPAANDVVANFYYK